MSQTHPGIAISNPDAYVDNEHEDTMSGHGPMSAAIAAELLSLAQRADEPDAYDDELTQLEAENRIKLLKRKLDG